MMMRSDDTYTPTEGCSAEELLKCLTADDYDACVAACSSEEPEEEDVANGFVTISKVSAAATQEVAANASKKNVWTIKLTAGEDGATVSSLVVKRTGLGTYNNVSISFANDANTITTSTKTFNSNNEATVRFSPALVLKANESLKLNALVTLAGANEEHSFEVTSANLANGKSNGSANLWTIRTTSYTVWTVGTTLALANTAIKAGETKAIVRVGLTPTRVASVNGFTLSKGTAWEDFDKAFSEVKAYVNNKEAGEVTMTSDKIIVKNLKLDKEAGETATVELRASWKYIWTATTATFVFDATADIDVVETNTHEAMQITTAPGQISLNLTSVDLTLTKVSTWTQTVVPGTSNVTLYNAKAESTSNFDVVNYTLTMTSSDTFNGLNDFTSEKITLNVAWNPIEIDTLPAWAAVVAPTCSVAFTPTTSTAKADCAGTYTPWTITWTFGNKDSFPVEVKNAAKITVKAWLKSTAAATNYQFNFAIVDVQDQDNTSNKITWLTVTENGDITTIWAWALTLKNATVAAPSSRNLWASDSNLEAGRFAIRATAENVSISKIVFTQVATTNKYVWNLTDVISSAKLVNAETDAVIAQNWKVDNTAKTVTFDGISLTAEKDVDLNLKLIISTNSFTIPAATANELNFAVTIANTDTNREVAWWNATVSWTPTLNTYVLNVKSPEVTLVKENDNVFKVTVKNVDTNNDLTLNSVDVRVKAVADNSSYKWNYCLRQEWSNETACSTLLAWTDESAATVAFATVGVNKTDLATLLNTTKMIPGATRTFTFFDWPTHTAKAVTISKNSSYTFEIYVDSDYVNPTTLMAEFTKATFNGTSTESYSVNAQ